MRMAEPDISRLTIDNALDERVSIPRQTPDSEREREREILRIPRETEIIVFGH